MGPSAPYWVTQVVRAAKPAGVVGKLRVPSHCPCGLRATATCRSRWVSTPTVTCTAGSAGAALADCVIILCLPPVCVQRRTGREGGQNCDGTMSRSYLVTAPQPSSPGATAHAGRQIKLKARGRLKNGSDQAGD